MIIFGRLFDALNPAVAVQPLIVSIDLKTKFFLLLLQLFEETLLPFFQFAPCWLVKLGNNRLFAVDVMHTLSDEFFNKRIRTTIKGFLIVAEHVHGGWSKTRDPVILPRT